jgi:hypothetical protein
MTGRSKTAVTQAAKTLQGKWIGRVRPENAAYHYRFLPEAVGDTLSDRSEATGSSEKTGRSGKRRRSGEPGYAHGPIANDLPPDRQKSDPPSSYKKSSSKDKHSQAPKRNGREPPSAAPRSRNGAVRAENSPEPRSGPNGEGPSSTNQTNQQVSGGGSPAADFSGLPPEKRDLAEKLQNVGVWAGRIAEILIRFSLSRIRANFELYRQQDREQRSRKPGAWLHQATTDGYALSSSDESDLPGQQDGSENGTQDGTLPEAGEKVSERRKRALIRKGLATGEDFDKFADYDDADQKQHFFRLE